MARVWNVLRAGDGAPGWVAVAQASTSPVEGVDAAGGYCQRCGGPAPAAPDSDVYLLEGQLHHAACVIEAMADNA